MAEQQQTNLEDEGTIILDPEMKKKQEEAQKAQVEKIEKMKVINSSIMETINKLAKDHGLKIMISAYHEELDEEGIWKSENVNNMELEGLAKLVSSKFQ